LGTQAARQLFKRHVGFWEVRVMRDNNNAARFWSDIISAFTRGDFTVIPQNAGQRFLFSS
jgi:predicted acetyltransferase